MIGVGKGNYKTLSILTSKSCWIVLPGIIESKSSILHTDLGVCTFHFHPFFFQITTVYIPYVQKTQVNTPDYYYYIPQVYPTCGRTLPTAFAPPPREGNGESERLRNTFRFLRGSGEGRGTATSGLLRYYVRCD